MKRFGGIKDIKLLNLEQSYLDRFGRPSKVFGVPEHTHNLIRVPNFLLEAIVFGTMLIVTLVLVITSGGFTGLFR